MAPLRYRLSWPKPTQEQVRELGEAMMLRLGTYHEFQSLSDQERDEAVKYIKQKFATDPDHEDWRAFGQVTGQPMPAPKRVFLEPTRKE